MDNEQKLIAAALKRLELLKKQEAFDPQRTESRPTPKQMEVIREFGVVKQQWIRAGNQSGKSQTCARNIAWAITDTHPTWKRPEEWNNEPLLILVAGRTGKQIEDSLLPKLRGFLEPGTYKEVRIGNIIQRLELDNGNRVVFQSLENPNSARERMQSYTAHVTWCDELPPTMELVRELLVRTQARNGYSLFSFTPTVIAVEIQRYVDSLKEPDAKVYRFNMLDNPLYADPTRKQELINRYAHLSEDQRRMVFEGEWLSSDDQVYYFDYSSMVEMPDGYSPLWRHVESVDPAISSALGLTLWAENPQTGMWYCILADYIRGILVPTDLVRAVQNLVKNKNIVRRTSDYAPWYTNTAASMGIHYSTVFNKNAGRKPELIKKFQESLGTVCRIAPHCEALIRELQECRWSDRSEGKIVNHSSFHLIDSAQYFVDIIPKRENQGPQYSSWDQYLYEGHMKRKELIAKVEKKVHQRQQVRNRWKRR